MRLPKYKQTFEQLDQLMQEGTYKLVLWGRNQKTRELCKRYAVAYIVDENDELCDLKVGGAQIFRPAKLYGEKPEKTIVVICDHEAYPEITAELDRIGDFVIFYSSPLFSGFLGNVSTELWDAYGEIQRVKDSLADDMSKKILQECVVRRICGCERGYRDLKVENEIQYLYRPAFLSKREGTILDIGGYTGNSVDRFVNAYGDDIKEIDSFEALPENVKSIEQKREELKAYWHGTLRIFPYAVADAHQELVFHETENKDACFAPDFRETVKFFSTKPVREFKVEAVAIDEILPVDRKVRLIKMDIEGAEYAALLGAKKTIQREKPGLAISIYHNPKDYYRLADLIRSYVPEYNLAVRHHKDRHVDTVLYAWV